jgi:hypothetical protein
MPERHEAAALIMPRRTGKYRIQTIQRIRSKQSKRQADAGLPPELRMISLSNPRSVDPNSSKEKDRRQLTGRVTASPVPKSYPTLKQLSYRFLPVATDLND